VNSQLDGIGNKLGIALPGDAVNLLGNEFAIGLDAVPSGSGSGRLTAITEPTDATKGLQTIQKLVGLTSQSRFPFTASAHGSQIVITNDSGATGALGDDAGFKNAMSGMPSQVVGAAYVNLAAIWASGKASNVPADIQHLSGIGAYESVDGSDLVFAVRVTVS
jgi:hypothetical protein